MAHQQLPPAVMEFVGRYKVLEAHRNKEQDLIKVKSFTLFYLPFCPSTLLPF
jgi:hypothetical protein